MRALTVHDQKVPAQESTRGPRLLHLSGRQEEGPPGLGMGLGLTWGLRGRCPPHVLRGPSPCTKVTFGVPFLPSKLKCKLGNSLLPQAQSLRLGKAALGGLGASGTHLFLQTSPLLHHTTRCLSGDHLLQEPPTPEPSHLKPLPTPTSRLHPDLCNCAVNCTARGHFPHFPVSSLHWRLYFTGQDPPCSAVPTILESHLTGSTRPAKASPFFPL